MASPPHHSIAMLLNEIALLAVEESRILTGYYLDDEQIEALRDRLERHDPYPNVGGVGRYESVPVFPAGELERLDESTTRADDYKGIRFTYVQMGTLN